MMLSTTRLSECDEKGDTSRACWWSMQWGQQQTCCVQQGTSGSPRKNGSSRQPGHTVRHEKPQWACAYVCAGWHKKVSTLLHSKARHIWQTVPSRQLAGGWGALWQQCQSCCRPRRGCCSPGLPHLRADPHHTDTGTTQHKEARTEPMTFFATRASYQPTGASTHGNLGGGRHLLTQPQCGVHTQTHITQNVLQVCRSTQDMCCRTRTGGGISPSPTWLWHVSQHRNFLLQKPTATTGQQTPHPPNSTIHSHQMDPLIAR